MSTILENSFLFTIILIVVSTLMIAFIKRVHIDKSLKGFRDDFVHVFMMDKAKISGKLDVANTGIELLYNTADCDQKTGEMSYIIYKAEYPKIAFFARYARDMNEKNRKRRKKQMKRAYHPNIIRKTGRGINNFFRTINDAIMDIASQISGKLSAASPNTAATQSSAYTKKINQELVNSMDTSFDPILEKYIGNVVVAEAAYGGETFKAAGVLKNYTAKYYELWDVDLNIDGTDARCDVLLPTATCKIRHVGEQLDRFSLSDLSFDIKKYDRYIKSLTSRKTLKKRGENGRLGK